MNHVSRFPQSFGKFYCIENTKLIKQVSKQKKKMNIIFIVTESSEKQDIKERIEGKDKKQE